MTCKSPREVLRLFGACARGAADASAGVPLNFKIGELTEEDPGPTWVDLGEYWSLKVMGQLMSPSSRMPTTASRSCRHVLGACYGTLDMPGIPIRCVPVAALGSKRIVRSLGG